MTGQHRGTRYGHVLAPRSSLGRAVSGTVGLGIAAVVAMVSVRGLLTGDPPAVPVRPSTSPTALSPGHDGGSGDAVPSVSPTPSGVSPESEGPAGSPRYPPFADAGTFVPLAAPASTADPTGDRVTARYIVRSTWDSGLVVRIIVHNPTTSSVWWKVVVSYPKAASITVTRVWGATVTGPGHRLSFRGGPLAPGRSTSFRFQADKDQPGRLRPDTCTVNGGACIGA